MRYCLVCEQSVMYVDTPIGGKIMSVNSVVHTDCYGHEVHNQKIEVSDVPGSYEFTMKQYYGIDNHTKLFGN